MEAAPQAPSAPRSMTQVSLSDFFKFIFLFFNLCVFMKFDFQRNRLEERDIFFFFFFISVRTVFSNLHTFIYCREMLGYYLLFV